MKLTPFLRPMKAEHDEEHRTGMQDTSSRPKSLSVAQVAKAVELVNYQDGAIVSREIIKKPTGTVTVFAFDKGEGLSEHTAPFDALV